MVSSDPLDVCTYPSSSISEDQNSSSCFRQFPVAGSLQIHDAPSDLQPLLDRRDSQMGELIHLATRRAARNRHALELPPAFFFDVSDPLSYLTAEHVERSLGEVEWIAVDGNVLSDRAFCDLTALREHAEARARALRLPLVWPDTFPVVGTCALRAA